MAAASPRARRPAVVLTTERSRPAGPTRVRRGSEKRPVGAQPTSRSRREGRWDHCRKRQTRREAGTQSQGSLADGPAADGYGETRVFAGSDTEVSTCPLSTDRSTHGAAG